MRKVFILLFISLALLSCQKEENNRKTEYQVLTSKDASKPFSCLGEKRIITITIIKKTLIDDVLSSVFVFRISKQPKITRNIQA